MNDGSAGVLVRGEQVAAVSAVVLLALMFTLKWYGVAAMSGGSAVHAANSTAESAWGTLTTLRWLMLATIVVTFGSVVLHLSQRGHGSQTDTSLLVTALGALTAVLLIYRVFIGLPEPTEVLDQKLGAVLGVFASIGIAFGGFDSLREERARARRLVQRSRRGAGIARGARAR